MANQADLPALVAFGLMDDYPEANLRHFGFMPEGLREVAATLAERGIGLLVRRRLGQPATVLTRMTF